MHRFRCICNLRLQSYKIFFEICKNLGNNRIKISILKQNGGNARETRMKLQEKDEEISRSESVSTEHPH